MTAGETCDGYPSHVGGSADASKELDKSALALAR
jgi:hypothetical protein